MRLKTPISYYGGKQIMLKHVLPLVPEHSVYTEAFAGGAALYWAKEPSKIEVINDINSNLVNFYKVLKDDFRLLKNRVDATLHSRRTHDFAALVYEFPEFFDSTERAWAVWVLSKEGFASKLDASWGYDRKKNSMCIKLGNAKESFSIELSKRLENTQIECNSALKVIASRDSENTFHFVDPPYVNSDCGHYSGTYNLQNFQELLELLSCVKGKFMLTMFPHDMLDEFIAKYKLRVVEVNRTISASLSNRRKQTELIVMNYDLNTV